MTAIYKSEAGRLAIEAFYRKALVRWPVANEHITIPTRLGQTFAVASGPVDGSPVVLLHGSGSNSAIWIRDVAEWSRQHRVYAIDMIGEPGLSSPSRPSLRSDAYVDWLDDVFAHLGLTSASLVGVSLGGWLALAYAVKRPARVASLTLLSPAGIGARKQLFMAKALLMLLLGRRGVNKAWSAASGKAPVAGPLADYVRLIFENFRPRREAPPVFTDAELRAVAVPTQVVVGADDAMLRAKETRRRVTRLLPHAEMIWLEGTGHMLPPQTTRVADFLSRAVVKHESVVAV